MNTAVQKLSDKKLAHHIRQDRESGDHSSLDQTTVRLNEARRPPYYILNHSVIMAPASPAARKPRRKPKKPVTFESTYKPEALVRTPSFPLAAFLWPARTSVSQWEVLPLILMAAGLFRWAAGLWGYSGQ